MPPGSVYRSVSLLWRLSLSLCLSCCPSPLSVIETLLAAVWRAVNPGAAREGVNKLEYYYSKFGKERVDSMVPAMMKNFADVGVKYELGWLV